MHERAMEHVGVRGIEAVVGQGANKHRRLHTMNFLDRCCIGNKRTAVHQHKVLKTHHKYRTSSRYSTAHGKISARHFRHGQINHIRTRGNRSGNTAWIG